jgi:DnaK suppressor protein
MKPLAAGQVAELRELLLRKRAELERVLVRPDADAPGSEPDPVDAASAQSLLEDSTGISAHAEATLREVRRALDKIDAGSYGVSELSGEPIGYSRLRSVPWARLTVEEESERERRRK